MERACRKFELSWKSALCCTLTWDDMVRLAEEANDDIDIGIRTTHLNDQDKTILKAIGVTEYQLKNNIHSQSDNMLSAASEVDTRPVQYGPSTCYSNGLQFAYHAPSTSGQENYNPATVTYPREYPSTSYSNTPQDHGMLPNKRSIDLTDDSDIPAKMSKKDGLSDQLKLIQENNQIISNLSSGLIECFRQQNQIMEIGYAQINSQIEKLCKDICAIFMASRTEPNVQNPQNEEKDEEDEYET